jgi:hypothetical protein
MTIRAKLYVAILLCVLGPVITTAVALNGAGSLGDRFDEVHERAERRALALDLKFDVTDVNGWQTAYGYDDGASRDIFNRAARRLRARLAEAEDLLTEPREQRLLAEIKSGFDEFMRLDAVAYEALLRGDDARVKEIFLGPELELFEAMARGSEELARYESGRATATETAFDDAREESRRALIAVALGAALVIVLLLVTAADIVRMTGERAGRARQ